MKRKIIVSSAVLGLAVVTFGAVCFSDTIAQSLSSDDSEPVIYKKAATSYMGWDGEISVTDNSIEYSADDIHNIQNADEIPVKLPLTVYYKDGDSEEWTFDAHTAGGNEENGYDTYYAWVCGEPDANGNPTRERFDPETIDYVMLDGVRIDM